MIGFRIRQGAESRVTDTALGIPDMAMSMTLMGQIKRDIDFTRILIEDGPRDAFNLHSNPLYGLVADIGYGIDAYNARCWEDLGYHAMGTATSIGVAAAWNPCRAGLPPTRLGSPVALQARSIASVAWISTASPTACCRWRRVRATRTSCAMASSSRGSAALTVWPRRPEGSLRRPGHSDHLVSGRVGGRDRDQQPVHEPGYLRHQRHVRPVEVNLIPMEPFYLGAYWGSRKESSLRCGQRMAGCIARLSKIDEALGSWFRRGVSKAAAKTPVELDAESLGKLLAQGVNRRDVGGDAIEELGFSIGLWNRARPAVGLSATVGAHPSFQGVLNSFVLDFPPPEAEALRIYEPSLAEAIFNAVVEGDLDDSRFAQRPGCCGT